MSEVTKITEEQLKEIKDQQAKLQAAFIDIGFIESKKHEALHIQVQASEALEATKKQLEKDYGQVNIDLTDGSYTIIEKEESASTLEKV
jgi:poly(A) polymerase Pap1|tara:strand:- start:4 stop:270 length:267 start_codon:yes stop_codon:yes gene_type:complete